MWTLKKTLIIKKKKKRGVAISLRGNSTHPALRKLIYSRSLWFNNFPRFGLATVDRRFTAQEVAGRQRQKDRERQRRKAERQTGKEGGKQGEREDLQRPPVDCKREGRDHFKLKGFIDGPREVSAGGTPPFLLVELPSKWERRVRSKPPASQHQASWYWCFIFWLNQVLILPSEFSFFPLLQPIPVFFNGSSPRLIKNTI